MEEDIIIATEEDIKAAAAPTAPVSVPIPISEVKPRILESALGKTMLPGDARVQQALRAVATPLSRGPLLGDVKTVLERATLRVKENVDESVRPDHQDGVGAFGVSKTSSSEKDEKGKTKEGVMDDPAPVNPTVLRTFEADRAEYIRANKVSMTTVALKEAERERTETTEIKHRAWRTVILVFFSLALLLGGGGIMLYFFLVPRDILPVKTVATEGELAAPEPIIFTETIKAVPLKDAKGKIPNQLLAREVGNANQKIGSIEAVILSETINGGQRMVGVDGFLNLVTRRVPPRLLRQLDAPYTFGVFIGSVNSGFLILTTKNFDSVFADMLAWEADLVRDMYAPLTGKEATKELLAERWKDTVLRNIDVRILAGDGVDDSLVWGFVNNHTLILAGNADTFKEILTRLTTPKPMLR